MTGAPPAGPASAYPTFNRPASTCFSGPNELFVPRAGASAVAAWTCVAIRVMAVAARMQRRFWLMISAIQVSPVRPLRTHSQGFDGGERCDDLIRRHDGVCIARDIDIARGVQRTVRMRSVLPL